MLVSNYNSRCSRGERKKIQIRETALILKGLKCERISEMKSTFSSACHRPLLSVVVVVCFGHYGRFVSFRSFRFGRFGCFVSIASFWSRVAMISFHLFQSFRLFLVSVVSFRCFGCLVHADDLLLKNYR